VSILTFLAMGLFFNVVTLVYAVVALRTLWQLAREWRLLMDATYTSGDRKLAWNLGFFLLTPVGVLGHELGHLVAARAFGAQQTSLTFWLYWGYVTYAPNLGAVGEFAVASAGPAVSLILGMAALVVAMRLARPWHHILQSFGMATLVLVLVLYPIMSYWPGFGDFTVIYGTSLAFTTMVAAVHVAGLLAFAILADLATQRDRCAHWAGLVESYPGRRAHFGDTDAVRLQTLERSWLRFLPGVRQEMNQLRDLRDWIVAHNRQLEESSAQQDQTVNGENAMIVGQHDHRTNFGLR